MHVKIKVACSGPSRNITKNRTVYLMSDKNKCLMESLCLHRASVVSKTLLIIPNDAHYYKITEMLKTIKNYNTCSDMFRFTQEPSSGSSHVLS